MSKPEQQPKFPGIELQPETGAAAEKPMRKPTKEATEAGMMIRIVSAARIVIHPLIGLSADDLFARYQALIEEELGLLRRNLQPLKCPKVMLLEDGRFGALTEISTAIAMIARAKEDANCRVTVIVVRRYSGALFVKDQLEVALAKCPWEQAKSLAQIRTLHGTLREWMRRENLDIRKWDPKCSKLTKLLELDSGIVDRIDPFSITNVAEAGKVVDAWADPEKKSVLERILQDEVAGKNVRVAAGPLFKKMLAAVLPAAPRAGWLDGADGARKLVDAQQKVVATLSIGEGGWKLEGTDFGRIEWTKLGEAVLNTAE